VFTFLLTLSFLFFFCFSLSRSALGRFKGLRREGMASELIARRGREGREGGKVSLKGKLWAEADCSMFRLVGV
jgi:hypothetical protein